MTIRELRIKGYRSIRDFYYRMSNVNVVVGPNGSGKTNLYRALHLLHAAADGRFARAVAEEGGMSSMTWAGPRKKGPVRVTLAVTFDEMAYEMTFGLTPQPTMFMLDPNIKAEKVWLSQGRRRVLVLERANTTAFARDADGDKESFPLAISPSESALSEIREPGRFPELARLRQELLGWRFYHQFRTDPAAPVRQPQIGFRTFALSSDGADLAAAFRTISEIGDRDAKLKAIADAFPGAQLIVGGEGQRFTFGLHMPGFQRPFSQSELSDGTLHYLCLTAALLSPRPPALLALNEPESSIHPDLYPALARLIAKASESSQLWVTTHSGALGSMLEAATGATPITLKKVHGETRIHGYGIVGPLDDEDEEEAEEDEVHERDEPTENT